MISSFNMLRGPNFPSLNKLHAKRHLYIFTFHSLKNCISNLILGLLQTEGISSCMVESLGVLMGGGPQFWILAYGDNQDLLIHLRHNVKSHSKVIQRLSVLHLYLMLSSFWFFISLPLIGQILFVCLSVHPSFVWEPYTVGTW